MGDVLGAMRYALHLQHECKAAYTENPTNQDSKRRQPTGTTYPTRETYINRLEGQTSDDTSAFSEYADIIRASDASKDTLYFRGAAVHRMASRWEE